MNIGLIPARGGSKGLPRKNIIDLNGLPLIAWSINAGLNSKHLDRIYVSTEDEEIAAVAEKHGAFVIPRPMELAQDTTLSEPVFEHAIEFLKEQGIEVDKLCVLQPTSPLRTSDDVDQAFESYDKNNAKCVLSVFEPKHTAAKAIKSTMTARLTVCYSTLHLTLAAKIYPRLATQTVPFICFLQLILWKTN